jgi:hypothetical protein
MDNAFTQFFANNVILTIAIIAFVIWMFMGKGGGGILGSWLVRILVIGMLAVWGWIALMSYLDTAWREANAKVDEATGAITDLAPDWMKELWQKAKDLLPSPEDKICDYAGISLACNVLGKVKAQIDQVVKDMNDTEALCKSSPATVQRFGDAGAVKFCTGFAGPNAQRTIKSIVKGVVQGAVTSAVPEFFLPPSKTLDSKEYLTCLYTRGREVPGADYRSCAGIQDPRLWRLCIEFHMQLPSEQLGQPPAPLDPRIVDCRALALTSGP